MGIEIDVTGASRALLGAFVLHTPGGCTEIPKSAVVSFDDGENPQVDRKPASLEAVTTFVIVHSPIRAAIVIEKDQVTAVRLFPHRPKSEQPPDSPAAGKASAGDGR